MTVRFDRFELDPAKRLLTRHGREVHMTPKAFDLLALLADEAPRVVTKVELHERLWPGTFVSDATLVGLVKELRRALADREQQTPIIRTAHSVGYALAAPIARGPIPPARVSHWIVAGSRRIALTDGHNVIGRDPIAAVALEVAGVSRRHAQIVVGEDGAMLEDLGSKNGTRVRGILIQAKVRIHDGDQIQVGPILVTYHVSAAGIPTETAIGSRVK